MAEIDIGSRGRLARLYAQHAPSALRLAYLISGNKSEAEDLVHDAVVRMAARFSDLRHEEAFPFYLKRAVVNRAASQSRRRRIERDWSRRQRERTTDIPDVATKDELWQAMLELPVRQRAVLVLRFYEDLSEAQTAETLAIPKGTVKSLTSRALESLREVIKDEA
ncbi:MAG: sigma-70 family RNA polymerase sigma factor [Actinomycetota bacterium]